MFGFVLAVTANLLWATVNIVDKFLVARFCKDGSIGSLLILSSFFPIVLVPIGLFFGSPIEELRPVQIGILILSGVLATCWMYFYFTALFNSDVRRVIPLFQLTPVFALLFGYFLLREIPQTTELVSAGVILLGALLLSYERSTARLDVRLICNLVTATLIIAFMNTLFKYVAIEADFWTSIMFQGVGTVLGASTLFILHSNYRSDFLRFMSVNGKTGLSLNALNETLVLVGNTLFGYALLIAPIALIQSMNAYQPLFVLIMGFFATFFFSELRSDDESIYGKIQKFMAIVLIICGSIFLVR